ncbi:MAG: hypothetical protein ABUL64_03350, partial [Singulisphaera sp.]
MKSCPFCNSTIEKGLARCPACDAPLASTSAETLDSGFLEQLPAGKVGDEQAAVPAESATAPAEPKRRVRAFLRKIVDRTIRSGRSDKPAQESQTDSRDNVLTYQH